MAESGAEWPLCARCGKKKIFDIYQDLFYCTCEPNKSLWKIRLERDIGNEFRRLTV